MTEPSLTDWRTIGAELATAGAVAEVVLDASPDALARLTGSEAAAILADQADVARSVALLCETALRRLGEAMCRGPK